MHGKVHQHPSFTINPSADHSHCDGRLNEGRRRGSNSLLGIDRDGGLPFSMLLVRSDGLPKPDGRLVQQRLLARGRAQVD